MMHGKKDRMRAKMEALMELMDVMEEAEMEDYESMKDEMPLPDSMKKVTVAAQDEEGLKEGLSKAEELLGQYQDMEDGMGMAKKKKKLLEDEE